MKSMSPALSGGHIPIAFNQFLNLKFLLFIDCPAYLGLFLLRGNKDSIPCSGYDGQDEQKEINGM